MFIGGTESDDEDTESNTDWRIGDARYSRADGGTWTQKDDFNLGIKISGHTAPEFLVSNLETTNIPLAFTRNTNLSSSKLAQSFSAANNVGGSSAEFDFDGITALLQSSDTTPAQLASSDIFVTVHSDTNGQPGDLVYTMIAPETYTLLPDGSHITFSAPPGSTLSSGVTYWVKFEIAPDSTFFVGEAEIFFGYTTDDTEVQGPYADNDWSIQDDSLWSPETLSWTTDPTWTLHKSEINYKNRVSWPDPTSQERSRHAHPARCHFTSYSIPSCHAVSQPDLAEGAQILLVGAILAPGQRTVAAALRVMGLSDDRNYARYHQSPHQSGGVVAPPGGWHPLTRARCSSIWHTRAMVR